MECGRKMQFGRFVVGSSASFCRGASCFNVKEMSWFPTKCCLWLLNMGLSLREQQLAPRGGSGVKWKAAPSVWSFFVLPAESPRARLTTLPRHLGMLSLWRRDRPSDAPSRTPDSQYHELQSNNPLCLASDWFPHRLRLARSAGEQRVGVRHINRPPPFSSGQVAGSELICGFARELTTRQHPPASCWQMCSWSFLMPVNQLPHHDQLAPPFQSLQ